MIQIVSRIVMILDYVAEAKKPVLLPELAEATGLERATCANIVASMSEAGLLEKKGYKRRYEYVIGPKIFKYSANASSLDELKQIAAPVMDAFAVRHDASCILAVLDGEERILIHESKSDSRLQVRHHERIFAYGSDMGRMILAHLPRADIDKFIEKYGLPDKTWWPAIHDRNDLDDALDQIRGNGSRPVLNADHVVTIFLPVVRQGCNIAGLGAYIPNSYFTEENQAATEASFKEMVLRISSAFQERKA